MSIAKPYTKIDCRTTDINLDLLTLDLIAIAHTEQFTTARKLIMQRLQELLDAQAKTLAKNLTGRDLSWRG